MRVQSYLGYRNDKLLCSVSEQLEQTAHSAFLFGINVHWCIGVFYNLEIPPAFTRVAEFSQSLLGRH